jgi:hypothetical protein
MDLGIRRATSAHPSGCQAKLAAAVPPTTTTVRTSRKKGAQFTFFLFAKSSSLNYTIEPNYLLE